LQIKYGKVINKEKLMIGHKDGRVRVGDEEINPNGYCVYLKERVGLFRKLIEGD
jgi:hypothetical protein